MLFVEIATAFLPMILTAIFGGGGLAAGIPIVNRVLTWLADKNNQAALASITTLVRDGLHKLIADRLGAADGKKPGSVLTAPLTSDEMDGVIGHIKALFPDLHNKLIGLGIDPDNLKNMVKAEFGKLLLERLGSLKLPAA